MDYDIGESTLTSILLNGRSHKLPKGQAVHSAEQRMLLNVLKSGYVKRFSINNDGSESIQSIYGPGDIFPLTPVFRVLYNKDIYRGQEVFYYEAMTEVSLSSIDEASLRSSVAENPDLYRDLLYVAGMRLGSNIQRLENTALRVANRKVAHQLAYYAEKFGKPNTKGVKITAPLTHQTLADVLNMARETVTICMSRLQEKGVIEQVDRAIVVPDVARLRKEIH